MATLPGVLLYERFGFEKVEETTVVTPDGNVLAAVSMRMAIPGERSRPIRCNESVPAGICTS